MRVRQVMTKQVVTVTPDHSVHDVRKLFDHHRFHHLLVVEGDRLVGVISDRDLLRNLSPFIHGVMERIEDRNLLKRRVHQIMRRRPITTTLDEELAMAACTMLKERVSCLPVLDEEDRPVGIVTLRDALAAAYDVDVEGVTCPAERRSGRA